jgi:hypothetical protein
MGLNLRRIPFDDWLENYGPDSRAAYLDKLQKHIHKKINPDAWNITDDEYPRIGSYTTYGVFRLCLQYVSQGDFEDELEDDEDIEREALLVFKRQLKPAPRKIRYANQFLDSGDTDTIFIPVLFDAPFEYDESFVSSLPAALTCLQTLAKAMDFDLSVPAEPEAKGTKWLPVATAKNVSRILYCFFAEKPDACVAFS